MADNLAAGMPPEEARYPAYFLGRRRPAGVSRSDGLLHPRRATASIPSVALRYE